MNVRFLALILVIIGGINWGLFAFGYNLVDMLFGFNMTLVKIVYILVAASAVYLLATINSRR